MAFSNAPHPEPVEGRKFADPAFHAPTPSRLGSSVPWKLTATGPVISTWPSARHSISSVPPSSTISALRPVRPRRAAATSAAQAPLPQAMVMPAPRSQTRKRRRCGDSTWTMPILARSGKIGSCSSRGPSAARSIASASSTKKVACGLPMLVQTGTTSGPSVSGTLSVSQSRASGISRQARRGRPISTPTRCLPAACASSSPATVSTMMLSLPFSRMTSAAMQRVPLPQASASPPSALRMRMKTSAPRVFAFSRTRSWSQPTPLCRSAMARTAFSASASLRPRASMTTKSLPSPCILVKGMSRMARYISPRPRPVHAAPSLPAMAFRVVVRGRAAGAVLLIERALAGDDLAAQRLGGGAHAILDRGEGGALLLRQPELGAHVEHMDRAGIAVELAGLGEPHAAAVHEVVDLSLRQRLDRARFLPGIGRRLRRHRCRAEQGEGQDLEQARRAHRSLRQREGSLRGHDSRARRARRKKTARRLLPPRRKGARAARARPQGRSKVLAYLPALPLAGAASGLTGAGLWPVSLLAVFTMPSCFLTAWVLSFFAFWPTGAVVLATGAGACVVGALGATAGGLVWASAGRPATARMPAIAAARDRRESLVFMVAEPVIGRLGRLRHQDNAIARAANPRRSGDVGVAELRR